MSRSSSCAGKRLQDLIQRYGLLETLDRDHFYPTMRTALAAIRSERERHRRMVEPEIVPRWEWRTFGAGVRARGTSAGRPHRRRGARQRRGVSRLGARRHVGKLRDELVDVKRLEQVDGAGLELWMPVMKTAFPLSADRITIVLQTLGVVVASLGRTSYTVEQFGDELVATTRICGSFRCTSGGRTTSSTSAWSS